MTVTYGFYDSIGGDRRYNAADMSKIFDGLITEGVYMHVADKLMVSPGSGLSVNVGAGRAWFMHTWTLNSEFYNLPISTPNILYPRTDLVVLEVNREDGVRANSFKVLTGIPGASPNPPDPVWTTNVHQYRLAEVYVPVGLTQITAGEITNKVGFEETPFVTSVLEGMDIDALINQWGDQWATWRTEQEADFMDWFNNLVAVLTPEVAANLLLKIDNLNATVDSGWSYMADLGEAYVEDATLSIRETLMFITGDHTIDLSPGTKMAITQSPVTTVAWNFNSVKTPTIGSSGIVVTDIGTPTLTPGKFQNALTLNGTDQGLAITGTTEFPNSVGKLNAVDSFVLGCWIKCGPQSTDSIIFENRDFDNDFGYRVGVSQLTGKIYALIGGGPYFPPSAITRSVSGTRVVTNNEYHYVVVVYFRNHLQIYVDGILDGEGWTPLIEYNVVNFRCRIGCGVNAFGEHVNFFSGQIDDLFIIVEDTISDTTIKQKYLSNTAQPSIMTTSRNCVVLSSDYDSFNNITALFVFSDASSRLTYSTILAIKYSKTKAPNDFDLRSFLWSLRCESNLTVSKTSPVNSTWYTSTVNLSIPKGLWNIDTGFCLTASKGTAGTTLGMYAQLLLDTLELRGMYSGFYNTGLVSTTATEMNSIQRMSTNIRTKTGPSVLALAYMAPNTSISTIAFKGTTAVTYIYATCGYI